MEIQAACQFLELHIGKHRDLQLRRSFQFSEHSAFPNFARRRQRFVKTLGPKKANKL